MQNRIIIIIFYSAGDIYKTMPSYGMGKGSRDTLKQLYFPGELNNAEPVSPGPVYEVPIHNDQLTYSFGGKNIDRSLVMKTGDTFGPIYEYEKYSLTSEHKNGEVNRLATIPGGDFTRGNNKSPLYTPVLYNYIYRVH